MARRRTDPRFVGAGNFLELFSELETNPHYFSTRSGAVAIWKELVVPSTSAIYPIVRDTVHKVGATAVVSDFISYGGAWATAETKAWGRVI